MQNNFINTLCEIKSAKGYAGAAQESEEVSFRSEMTINANKLDKGRLPGYCQSSIWGLGRRGSYKKKGRWKLEKSIQGIYHSTA